MALTIKLTRLYSPKVNRLRLSRYFVFLLLLIPLFSSFSEQPALAKRKRKKRPQIAPVTLKRGKQTEEQVNSKKERKKLEEITKESKKNQQKTIEAINFIQPSIGLKKEEKEKLDQVLSRAEQEQLIILWRATLERNKTIHFIVQKLSPESNLNKKNVILSRIVNTAIFLPFYALQAVAPTDTGAIAGYLAAGVTGDLIGSKSEKEKNKLQLSQTEMVIMFMMIDGVAQRVREQYQRYKQSKIDLLLLDQELESARSEASLSLELSSEESRFLSQIRINQLERSLRRADWNHRSYKISLIDLCGQEAVKKVNELISKEVAVISEQPLF